MADAPQGAGAALRRCASCGAALTGPYCSACGQRVLERRHTLRAFAAGAAARIFNVERGLVHTGIRLTVAPGHVVRDFVSGRTNVYMHPLPYLLLSFAVFALATRAMGGVMGGGADRLFTAPLIFTVAAAGRLVFWKRGLNYAEHLIMAMYLFGHAVLMATGVQVVLYAAVSAGLALDALMVPILAGAGVAVAGWAAWAYAKVFDRSPVLGAAGGLAAIALGAVGWMWALIRILEVLRNR